jgi:hypothetical protein
MKNLETRRSRPATAPATAPATRVGSDNPATARREPVVAAARELARRRSGTIEVLLLWHPQSGGVELAVRDLATDASFHLEVAPIEAIDAFYHPYAYAARRTKTGRV